MSGSDVDALVEKYGMQAHPEGGFFVETYRSGETTGDLPTPLFPGGEDVRRSFSTCILFLIPEGERSSLHRIASDEVWHFYAGDPIAIEVLDEEKQGGNGHSRLLLGNPLVHGDRCSFQHVVPAGLWFGARLEHDPLLLDQDPTHPSTPKEARKGYALVGCTVSPGFDFADFELAKASDLHSLFPHPDLSTLIDVMAQP